MFEELGFLFDGDFSGAVELATGRRIGFTRSERILLATLIDGRGRVQTRQHLLDRLEGEGSEANDRSIDFLINRLRRKLGDSARTPRFIRTQYGQGYVWVATPSAERMAGGRIDLAVGPVHRNDGVGGDGAATAAAVDLLIDALGTRLSGDRRVARIDGIETLHRPGIAPPLFALGIVVMRTLRGGVDAVLALNETASGECRHVLRATLPARAGRMAERRLDALARTLLEAMRAPLPEGGTRPASPLALPLTLRLEAAVSLASAPDAARRAAIREAEQRLAAPGAGPAERLALAAAIEDGWLAHARRPDALVAVAAPPDEGTRARLLALVEEALASLDPGAAGRFVAARLLAGLDPAALPRALDIARDAFDLTTAAATAFVLRGDLEMRGGSADAAADLLARAQHLAPAGGALSVHVMLLSLRAAMAAGEDEVADALATTICRHDPALAPTLSLVAAPDLPDGAAARRDQALSVLGAAGARDLLMALDRSDARLFADPARRARFLRRPAGWIVARFGTGAVPGPLAPMLGVEPGADGG